MKTPLRRALFALPVLIVVGCTARQPVSPRNTDGDTDAMAAPRPHAPFVSTQVAATLARLRGLPLRSAVDAEELDDDAFKVRLATAGTCEGKRDPRGVEVNGFWLAFGFAPPQTGKGENASVAYAAKKVRDEQVAGFYDPCDKSLVVRKDAISAPTSQMILTHEVEHALQDQTFPLVSFHVGATDDDARLARQAVVEGDAMLAMLAYDAARGTPPKDWLVRATRRMRAMSFEDILASSGESPALRAAPPLMQRRTMFPYITGLTFVADVFRAGGFRLVDKIFTAPPTSTEQVLHPAKYVAGELPVPVSDPSAPAGWKTITTGRLGEMQLGVFLDQCAGPDESGEEQATGWGGDAYAVVQSADGRIAILLSTVWDDEDSAAIAEEAFTTRRACLHAIEGLHPKVGTSVHVVRDGLRVSYVQGLSAHEAPAVARRLLQLPRVAPANVPPIGAIEIPSDDLPEERFLHRGVVAGGAYASDMLGLHVQVPDGFQIAPTRANSVLEVALRRDAPSFASSVVAVSLSRATPTAMDAMAKEGLEAMRKDPALARAKVEETKRSSIVLPIGEATLYLLRLDNGWRVGMVVAPVCDERGMISIFMRAEDDDAQIALGKWLRMITIANRSPACAYLAE